jgi:hypothetical protein
MLVPLTPHRKLNYVVVKVVEFVLRQVPSNCIIKKKPKKKGPLVLIVALFSTERK